METREIMVPMPEIEGAHWKVGDGMDDANGKYIISNIIIRLTADSEKSSEYGIDFIKEDGEIAGSIDGLVLLK